MRLAPGNHLRCKSVVVLANVLPVNVCNIISDYNKADCFKCQCLKEKEESLMKEPYLRDDGLEKAEAQLLFFRSMFNPAARPPRGAVPGPAAGRTTEGSLGGVGPSFFPCPPGGGVEAEPQARSIGRLFLGLRRSRRPPPSKLRREAEHNAAKARLSLRFSIFFRSPGRTGRALSSPSRRVLRRSDVGLFFFLSGRAAHRGGDPRFHRGSAGLGFGGGEGATFFFGVGRDPQIRFAGGIDGGARREGPFPFLLLPPFWVLFLVRPLAWPCSKPSSAARRFGPKAFRPAAGRLFFRLFVSPLRPRQADARALRQELERLKAHPSTVEIDRPRFRVRGLPRRRRSGRVEDPLRRFPFFPNRRARSLAGQ